MSTTQIPQIPRVLSRSIDRVGKRSFALVLILFLTGPVVPVQGQQEIANDDPAEAVAGLVEQLGDVALGKDPQQFWGDDIISSFFHRYWPIVLMIMGPVLIYGWLKDARDQQIIIGIFALLTIGALVGVWYGKKERDLTQANVVSLLQDPNVTHSSADGASARAALAEQLGLLKQSTSLLWGSLTLLAIGILFFTIVAAIKAAVPTTRLPLPETRAG